MIYHNSLEEDKLTIQRLLQDKTIQNLLKEKFNLRKMRMIIKIGIQESINICKSQRNSG